MMPMMLRRGSYVGPNVKSLSATNVLTGMASTAFRAVGSLPSFTPARVNDGTLLLNANIVGTAFMSTFGSSASQNNGAGVEITFSSAKSLGKMALSCYGTDVNANCSFQVDAYVGGAWVSAGSPTPNTGPANFGLRDILFNSGATISSDKWRIYIVNWTGINNFYAGELQAFEFV